MASASSPSPSPAQPIIQMQVDELAERLQILVAPLQLIDVREPDEWEIVHLDNFILCPLSQFEQWSGSLLDRLDPGTETIVMCHHGIRSAYMCQWLQDQGFTQVKNVVGGIDAYAIAIEPNLRRY